MKKEILINALSNQIRIAITEEGRLAEFFLEHPDKARNVGDIYLGKVGKVIPGIRAAFIDLGFPQDAFLHFSDIGDKIDEYSELIGDDSDIDEDDGEDDEEDVKDGSAQTAPTAGNMDSQNIPALERDQDIVVQVTKEPVGNKGLRVTSKVSIPGRYLVLLPFEKKIGLSKRIFNPREKRRLRQIVRSALPKGFGVIIRTVASNQEDKLILDDLNNLIKKWNEIQSKLKTLRSPSLVYKDLSTTSSVIRDLFKVEVTKVIVDSKKLFKEIRSYLESTSPEFTSKLEYYSGLQPLFDAYNIEKQLEDSLERKVWLKNGGYLIIEPTEAMTVIDVNSGKYAKHREQELNSLSMNIEAGKELVRQLRLRDIGGIIVVDFIDLYDERNKRKLFEELKKEFRADRAKTTVLPMSDFGVVQITRQRIRQNILQTVSELCPMCKGSGRIESKSTLMNRIERWLKRFKAGGRGLFIVLKVNPILKSYLTAGFFNRIRKLSWKYFIVIKITEDTSLSLNEFRFFKRNKDITEDFSA